MPNSTTIDINEEAIQWLLEGDVSIQYQAQRDLLDADKSELRELQQRIPVEGWGARFLQHRKNDGHWGKGFYQPKWTSTHYTLLDLKNLGFPPGNPLIEDSLNLVLSAPRGKLGGINYGKTNPYSDVCVNGMILNYASWFLDHDDRLVNIADYLLDEQMNDGGWNCERYQGAHHSSLHSTISVLEGLLEWSFQSDADHINKVANAIKEGEEFILRHRLFRSQRTGQIIDPKMTRISYPCRWRFDILRGLDYFRYAGRAYDPRMQEALDIMLKKRQSDGLWPLQAKQEGSVHFEMETTGAPSRWNTLRALRVLQNYDGSF
ncbi:MAG: hypothetical protein ACQETE_10020 [Bacteroidota bacterium]